MIKILFAALILGCLISDISSQRGDPFEFYDSRGRCWRCLPGSSCVRCPRIGNHAVPPTWDRTCQKPSGAICSQWPGTKFPSRCVDHFYLCAADGSSTRSQCPTDKFFDMKQQECVYGDEITGGACDNYLDLDTPCPPEEEYTTTTATTVSPPPPGPDPDNGTTTTTTMGPPPPGPDPNYGTTTTTTVLPPGPTPDPDAGATKPPCVCVVWWPCWCNPCWNMPCHSCNGCVGMMG